ncbi:MAG: hypothetical protein M1826_003772 [Phylliscum demangeonii]|nr:MAG: hypothetical protein M1826_003772 [Phylliscum demangeonii]
MAGSRQHSKEEKEKAVRHDLRHQWHLEAERTQERARQPPLSSVVAAPNVPDRGRDLAASFAAERARAMMAASSAAEKKAHDMMLPSLDVSAQKRCRAYQTASSDEDDKAASSDTRSLDRSRGRARKLPRRSRPDSRSRIGSGGS